MPFRPQVGQQLQISDRILTIAEHPAARGIPYGQEGRQGIVYALFDSAVTRSPTAALKVFKPHYRSPFLADLAGKLAPFGSLPGLRVCQRSVLLPQQEMALLDQNPDLIYAMLMPWVPGLTWMEVVLERKSLLPADSLRLARAFAEMLTEMEQRGVAHGDLSAPNVMLPGEIPGETPPSMHPVELVDVEQMYAPGLTQPPFLPGGSPGYAHPMMKTGIWSPEMDRFAGGLLVAEMLAWSCPAVRDAAWQESYFAPGEMQQDCGRRDVLTTELEKRWGQPVVPLFERTWNSESLRACPTFGEWMVALSRLSAPASPGDSQVGILLVRARRLRMDGRLEEALAQYQRLAERLPADSSLLREIHSSISELQAELATAQPPPPPVNEPAAPDADVTVFDSRAGKPAPVAPPAVVVPPVHRSAEPARSNRWLWLGAGLGVGLVGLVLLALVIGLYLRTQVPQTPLATVAAAVSPTSPPPVVETPSAVPTVTAESGIDWSNTATFEAEATLLARSLATATARARPTTPAPVPTLEATATSETERDDNTPAVHEVAVDSLASPASPEESTGGLAIPTIEMATPAKPAAATLSGKLAFSLAQGTSYKSYVVLVSESAPQSLYADLGNARHPALSYDGSRLLFNGTGGGMDAIGLASSDGRDPRPITCVDATGESGRPVWAPDGVRFAFDGLGADPANPPIYIQSVNEMDCDLVDNRLQIGGGFPIDANGLYPLWGPDNRIYFRSCATWDPAGASQCGIWSVTPDGSDLLRLFDDPNFLPTSVGSSRLLLMAARDGNWEVYSVGLQGGVPQNLTNQPTTEVWGTLSPDGRSMAYLSNQGGGWAIWLANADGSNARAWKPIGLDLGEVDPNRIAQERMSWSK